MNRDLTFVFLVGAALVGCPFFVGGYLTYLIVDDKLMRVFVHLQGIKLFFTFHPKA